MFTIRYIKRGVIMNIYYDVEDDCYRTYPDGDIATIGQMEELIKNKDLSILKFQQENEQLKIQIRSREEKYRKLEDKYKELDKVCELYSKSLYNAELNQYKDNWNKLKEHMIKEQARIVIENTDEDEFVYTDLLNKMQQLEQGSDSNE